MLKILLSLLIITIFPFCIFAQQDTTLDEVTFATSQVKAAEIEQLNQQEEERTKQIANLLGFVLPEYTDNPSYVITFTDPSTEKKGVEIGLDGKSFVTIKSPYTFPALSIGSHIIKFRFYDQTNTIKILEYELIVTPRAPITSTPEIGDNSIFTMGTALANSDVIYILSANAYNDSGIVKTDEDGKWAVKISPEGGISDGIYTFTAYTRKYGYASDFASPITFNVGENSIDTVDTDSKKIYFSFKDINKDNLLDVVKENQDLLILCVAIFLIGILLANILRSIIDSSRSESKIKEVEKLFKKDKDGKEKESKTLREMFGDSGKKDETKDMDEKIKNDELNKNAKKLETIINKDIFLKKYKILDPDSDTGKEKEKKIKISLTSKEE